LAGGRIWTDEEKLFLEEYIGKKSLVNIAKKLDRTVDAVVLQATRMGIGNTREESMGYTLNQISNLTGVAMKTMKRWIERKGFPVKKKVTRISKVTYFVDPELFWEWVHENKGRVNCFVIEKNAIIPEPEWVDEQRKIDYYNQKTKPIPWTMLEEEKLKKMLLEERLTYRQASQRLPNRTPIAVQRHWVYMRERYPELIEMYQSSREPQNVL
jgi:hypothetical protein